ncbi:unnamed protein product [Lasius platythorax]|uniref:Uncharacterized protein n=1 Tax=Lasius platythorax TaxID=488582 RepID=A0AAV2NW63_9HYME
MHNAEHNRASVAAAAAAAVRLSICRWSFNIALLLVSLSDYNEAGMLGLNVLLRGVQMCVASPPPAKMEQLGFMHVRERIRGKSRDRSRLVASRISFNRNVKL